MAEITLRQLRYFDALAHHRHFGRAADASAISQPALSIQIKELEATLGAILFERGARQVRMTRFGEEFALRVGPILRAVEELGDLARTSGDMLGGEFRLGVIPTIAPYLLPRILGALGQDMPELEVMVRETVTPRLIEELSDGRLDAAVVALPVSEPTLKEVALFEEAMLLIRPDHEAGEPVPTGGELGRRRLLLLEEGHCFRDQALSFCSLDGRGMRDGLDGSSLSTLVQMVGAGLGVTLIPEMAVPVETRSAAVAVDAFPDPQPFRTVGMVWREANPLAPRLEEIAGRLRKALAPDPPN